VDDPSRPLKRVCAVQRRRSPVGANPRSSQQGCRFADTASFDAALMDFGLGPHEWLGICVVVLDKGVDVLCELLDRGEGGPLQGVALQDRKPALDLRDLVTEPARPASGGALRGPHRLARRKREPAPREGARPIRQCSSAEGNDPTRLALPRVPEGERLG
jgi:hypothetical protein